MQIILVHGAGHGAWCWDYLTPLLTSAAVAVDLPGPGRTPYIPATGLRDFADTVTSAATDEEVVLVGHSFAGACLPVAAASLGARVRHVVFIAAAVPLPGEDVFDAFPRATGRLRRTSTRLLGRSGVLPPAPRRMSRQAFCNDMDKQRTDFVLDHLTPELVVPALERASVTIQDIPEVPATYIRLLRDKVLKPHRQTQLAERLGGRARLIDIDSGHDVMISHPQALADVLNNLPI